MNPKLIVFKLLLVVVYLFYTSESFANNYSINQNVFIENTGQITNQFGENRPDIKYSYSNRNFKFFAHDKGFSYELWEKSEIHSNEYRSHRVDFELVGSADPNFKHIKEISGYSIYASSIATGYTSKNHHAEEILMGNIYKNTQLHFRTDQNALKYDIIVAPGGNLKDVRIKINGANSLAIDEHGTLVIRTDFGDIIESIPKSFLAKQYDIESGEYSELVPIEVTYHLDGNILTFTCEEVPKDMYLIVDPHLKWASYFGGNSADDAFSIATDGSGYIYVTGTTSSTNKIATSGTHKSTFQGYSDAYVAKFNPDGQLMWASYFGGTDQEDSRGIAVTSTGKAVIVGTTSSETGIATPGAYKASRSGTDGFIALFNSNGTLDWSTYFGTDKVDQLLSVTLAVNNDILIAGYTDNTAQEAPPNVDGFIAKMTNSGQFLWKNDIAGDNNSTIVCNDITTDGFGNIIVVGQTNCTTGIGTAGVHQQNIAADQDGFIRKYNESGTLQWGSYYGSDGADLIRCVVADANGNIFFGGYTTSTIDIASLGAYQTDLGGGAGGTFGDGFLARFSPNGTRNWATYFGGGNEDYVLGIDFDNSGNIFVVGVTSSPTKIATSNTHRTVKAGGDDGFIAKFTSSGARSWSTYYGGRENDNFIDLVIDNSGSPVVCGTTRSPSILEKHLGNWTISTAGTHQTVFGGQMDGIVAKFESNPSAFQMRMENLDFDDYCAGLSINIHLVVSQEFQDGNKFIVELSDEFGNFANARILDTFDGKKSDTLRTQLPFDLKSGNRYRVRVRSTKPSSISLDNAFDLEIKGAPVGEVKGQYPEVCINSTHGYKIDLLEPAQIKWNVTNGVILGPDNQDTCTIKWDELGVAAISVSVNPLSSFCQGSIPVRITVVDVPIVEYYGDGEVCANTTEMYTATMPENGTYRWEVDFGTILGSAENDTIYVKWNDLKSTNSQPIIRKGKVKLVQTTAAGCKDSVEREVIVTSRPNPNFAGNANPCAGCEETYIAIPADVYDNYWRIENGEVIARTDSSITVKWGNSGNAKLVLIQDATGWDDCKDSIVANILIGNALTPTISGNFSACEQTEFTYNTTSDATIIKKWYAMGGNIVGSDDEPNVVVRWNNSGIGTIKVVHRKDALGYHDSLSKDVTINELPIVTLNDFPEVCANDKPFELTGGKPEGGKYEGLKVLSNINFNPEYAGAGYHEISYVYTDENGCENKSTKTIYVKPLPAKPVVTRDNSNRDLLISSVEENIQWYRDNKPIDGAINKTYLARINGKYKVLVVGENGCTNTSDELDVVVGVEEISINGDIKIFPNPADEKLNIILPSSPYQIIIEVKDLMGSIQQTLRVQPNTENLILDVSSYQAGVYLIVFRTPSGEYYGKVVIQ